jgi:hypothetical protein
VACAPKEAVTSWIPSRTNKSLRHKSLRQESLPSAKAPAPAIPAHLRILGVILRAIFFAAMMAITVRVASPQSESIWSIYETPGDLIRAALGLILAVWILFNLFTPPKDPDAYRTWIYLGLAAVPFAGICVFAVW